MVGDMLRSTELKACMLRIAVQFDLANRTDQPRGEFDKVPTGHIVRRQFALLAGEDLAVLPLPIHGQ